MSAAITPVPQGARSLGRGSAAAWLRTAAGKLQRSSDAVLAAGVLAMIALMILPVRPWLLDIFLTLNLGAGAVLLMTAVLTPSGAKVFTFPTLLILTTLFRLALDVSSTRLILSEAAAGEVIRAFGEFAAGGSVAVGLIVFLMITMVQLIVISKGAERTANANAVFVRESIGGRQHAIESDANANRISAGEVTAARRAMNTEVEFFGRMYGAMEFVKGDAVAGLVVSAINIVGGLVVGIAVKHMSIGESIETYTLLTVGAGLVSQIPALVGSVAGSILVSRVSAHESGEGLGRTAYAQFVALPKALLLAGVMLAGLGLLPGMPTLPFLLLGAALVLSGRAASKGRPESGGISGAVEPAEAILPAVILELRHAQTLGADELALIRDGAARLLLAYSERSGIPAPQWMFREVPVIPDGRPLRVFRQGTPVCAGDSWRQIAELVIDDIRFRPAEYFGPTEANRWMQMARKGNERAVELLEAQLGMPQSPGGEIAMYRLLRTLVEERIPVNLTWSIVNAIAAPPEERDEPSGLGKISGGIDDRLSYAKHVRTVLRENTAQFFNDYYRGPRSRCLVVRPDSDLTRALSALAAGDSAATETAENIVRTALPKEARHDISIIVIDKHRRTLWRICERMFERQELYRPVLVLYPEVMNCAAMNMDRSEL
jgi:hypothetical protein